MIKNRIIFEELFKQKDDHKISLLIGARQVGKTTLLKQLYDKICVEKMKNEVSGVFPNYEIIAVIDGGKDTSFKEAKKVNGIKVVSFKENQGKGAALKEGFAHSTGEYITFADADRDIPIKQIKNFILYMATADLIIGSKRHPFSKVSYPISRKILSKGFQIYSWLVLQTKLRDTQSGLKLIKREVLEVIMPLILVKRYAFDLELCFLAQKHGFRTVEAPIYVNFDNSKKGAASWKTVLGMFLDVLAIRYRYSFINYYQKKFWEGKFNK